MLTLTDQPKLSETVSLMLTLTDQPKLSETVSLVLTLTDMPLGSRLESRLDSRPGLLLAWRLGLHLDVRLGPRLRPRRGRFALASPSCQPLRGGCVAGGCLTADTPPSHCRHAAAVSPPARHRTATASPPPRCRSAVTSPPPHRTPLFCAVAALSPHGGAAATTSSARSGRCAAALFALLRLRRRLWLPYGAPTLAPPSHCRGAAAASPPRRGCVAAASPCRLALARPAARDPAAPSDRRCAPPRRLAVARRPWPRCGRRGRPTAGQWQRHRRLALAVSPACAAAAWPSPRRRAPRRLPVAAARRAAAPLLPPRVRARRRRLNTTPLRPRRRLAIALRQRRRLAAALRAQRHAHFTVAPLRRRRRSGATSVNGSGRRSRLDSCLLISTPELAIPDLTTPVLVIPGSRDRDHATLAATRNRTTTRSREATRHPASAPETTLEPGLGFCPGLSRPAPPCPGPRGNPGARPWLVRPPPATIGRLTAASHPPAPLLYHRGFCRASASLAATLAPCSRLGNPRHIGDLGDLRRAHSRQPTL